MFEDVSARKMACKWEILKPRIQRQCEEKRKKKGDIGV